MRISVFSTQVTSIYMVSGLLMIISIYMIFRSDYIYRAEAIIILFWLYFTHSSMLKANMYIVYGVALVLVILIQYESRHSKDSGQNKIWPVILIGLFSLLIFYLKDDYSFETFFSITEGILD